MTFDLGPLTLTAVTAAFLLIFLSLPGARSQLGRTLIVGLGLAFLWRYLLWRIIDTLPPPALSLDFVCGAAFALVEIVAGIGSTMTWIVLTRTCSRTAQADAGEAWVKSHQPSVAVLVCTYNEDRDILERTLNGARALRYSNVRIVVCDDGRREWLRDLCRTKGCLYLTRPDNSHAKAGNINHALQHLAVAGPKPDFVAVLDADFVPFPNFLTRALALCSDEDVGLVQTPQHFFNPDPIQSNLAIARVFPDEQRFFFETLMPAKDAWGQAFCCGTSCIIRFDALQSVGYFPTGSVTEDFLLSAKLAQSGYRTIYLNERLSVGLAPEGLGEYTTQRARWCLGAMQIIRGPDGPFNFANGLPLGFRLGLIETGIFWSMVFLFRVLCQLATPAFLLFGVHIFNASLGDCASYFGPMLVAQFVAATWVSEGRMLPIMVDVQQLLIAPEVIRAVFSALFVPTEKKFKVTAKGVLTDRNTVHWRLLVRYGVLIAANFLGVANALSSAGSDWIASGALGTIFWTWYNLAILLICCLVCVERPRHRQHERYEVRVKGLIRALGKEQYFSSRDVSVGGMSFEGSLPGSIGDAVSIRFSERELAGLLCRRDESGFAIMFTDAESREAMTSFIYNETICKESPQLNLGGLVTRLIKRAAA